MSVVSDIRSLLHGIDSATCFVTWKTGPEWINCPNRKQEYTVAGKTKYPGAIITVFVDQGRFDYIDSIRTHLGEEICSYGDGVADWYEPEDSGMWGLK